MFFLIVNLDALGRGPDFTSGLISIGIITFLLFFDISSKSLQNSIEFHGSNSDHSICATIINIKYAPHQNRATRENNIVYYPDFLIWFLWLQNGVGSTSEHQGPGIFIK